MQITKDMKIAGVPAVALRNAFKEADGSDWGAVHFAGLLKVSAGTARKYIRQLLAEGYIEPAHTWEGVRYYRITQLGSQLSEARAAKPITRKTAERLLVELRERAEEINRDAASVYQIRSLAVFGSYLSDATRLGDLDVMVELSDHPTDMDYFQLVRQHARTFRRLQGKSRALSLHPSTDDIARAAEPRQIHTFPV